MTGRVYPKELKEALHDARATIIHTVDYNFGCQGVTQVFAQDEVSGGLIVFECRKDKVNDEIELVKVELNPFTLKKVLKEMEPW